MEIRYIRSKYINAFANLEQPDNQVHIIIPNNSTLQELYSAYEPNQGGTPDLLDSEGYPRRWWQLDERHHTAGYSKSTFNIPKGIYLESSRRRLSKHRTEFP